MLPSQAKSLQLKISTLGAVVTQASCQNTCECRYRLPNLLIVSKLGTPLARYKCEPQGQKRVGQVMPQETSRMATYSGAWPASCRDVQTCMHGWDLIVLMP